MINPDLRKAWTTHMGILVKILYMSQGDVIELGAGPSSTPLLHWVCRDMNRKLISYESHPDYYIYARQFQSRLHRIRFVKDWDEIDTKTHCGVVFIDHHPSDRRGIEAARFKDSADYIVMHDTNYAPDYKDAPTFKYSYIWKESRPWVTVASNFKSLLSLEKNYKQSLKFENKL